MLSGPSWLTFSLHAWLHGLLQSCMLSQLVGGRVPLRPFRLSPSERKEYFPSYRACDRVRGPHIVLDGCINRWSVSPTHGSPTPTMPSPRHHSPSPLPAYCSTSTSSYVGSPLLVLFLLLVFVLVKHGHSVWQCHDLNRPYSHNSSLVHPPATAAVDLLPIANRTRITINSPSAPGHFQSEASQNPQGVISPW